MLLPLLVSVIGQAANLPPTAELILPKTPVKSGKPFQATLKLKFSPGLHGYQNPPSDEFEIPVAVKVKSPSYKLVSVSYPKGVAMSMAGAPAVKVYSGTVNIGLTLKKSGKTGPLLLDIHYQQCTESSCFPPADLTVKAAVPVAK